MLEKNVKEKIKSYILFLLPFLYLFILVPAHFPTYNGMFIDSGVYAYMAQQINKGKLLYRDTFDMKFPAIYYIYAFIFKIFPDSRWTLYFCDFFTNLLILFFTFRILKNYKVEKFFWIVGIFLINIYRIYPSFSGGNLNEHFFLLFFLLALSFLTSENTKLNNFFLGFSFSFLFFFKQPYILLPLLLIFLFKNRFFSRENLKYFFIGFAPIFLFFTFIWIKALPYSFVATILTTFAWSSSVKRSIADLIHRLRLSFLVGAGKELFLLILPVLFTSEKKLKLFFLSILFILFLIYFSTPALYSHYFLLLYIPILIATIIILKNYPSYFVISLFLFLSLIPHPLIKKRIYHTKKAIYGFFVELDWRIRVHPICKYPFQYMKKGEKFIMIPEYPEVYFITGTESPFRFHGFGDNISTFFKDELKKSIREKPPDYVYLEVPISSFEKIFSLKKEEYRLVPLDKNFYKFYLLKK